MGSKLGALRFPTLSSDRRTIHRHSPPNAARASGACAGSPLLQSLIGCGVRFGLTTFGLWAVKSITTSLPFSDLRNPPDAVVGIRCLPKLRRCVRWLQESQPSRGSLTFDV